MYDHSGVRSSSAIVPVVYPTNPAPMTRNPSPSRRSGEIGSAGLMPISAARVDKPRTESGPSFITPPLTSCVRRVLTGDSECNKDTAPPHEPCDGCEGDITDEPIETTTDDYCNEDTSKPV